MRNKEKTNGTSTQVRRTKGGKFAKGVSGNPGGMKPGVKHKATEVKMAFFQVFDKIGGVDAFVDWVQKKDSNLREFYKMLIQVVPKDMNVEGDVTGGKFVVMLSNGKKLFDDNGRLSATGSAN